MPQQKNKPATVGDVKRLIARIEYQGRSIASMLDRGSARLPGACALTSEEGRELRRRIEFYAGLIGEFASVGPRLKIKLCEDLAA